MRERFSRRANSRILLDIIWKVLSKGWGIKMTMFGRSKKRKEAARLRRAFLKADISKAREVLGWEPRITFEELTSIMVDCDSEFLGVPARGEGKEALKGRGLYWTENKLSTGLY